MSLVKKDAEGQDLKITASKLHSVLMMDRIEVAAIGGDTKSSSLKSSEITRRFKLF